MNLDLKEITNKLNIIPYRTNLKGHVRNGKYGDYICPEDSWMAQYVIPKEQTLEEAINAFIKPYLNKKEIIKELKEKFKVIIWLSLYPEHYQMSIELSAETLSKIHELNVCLSITASYLADIYNG